MSVGIVDKQTGDRIPTAGMPAIDNALSATSTNPVQNAIITAALANKQDKTDNSLQTTDKTVVGAINEHEGDISSLKSGLTNLVKSIDCEYTFTTSWSAPNGTNIYLDIPATSKIIGVLVTDINGSGLVYTPIKFGNALYVRILLLNGTIEADTHTTFTVYYI